MSRVTMLPIDELRATRLSPLIDRALEMRAPDPAFFSVMGHNIDTAEAFHRAWTASFTTGAVRQEVKESIRVKLSRLAGCNY
jgi:hypothetical protein